MGRQKRLAAVHDISCFGRCSLTVALPIISAAGIEVSCVPTAILSTHTGGFTDYAYRDLTGDMPLIIAHWEKLALEFDAIYTGYLGSFAQIDIVADMFDKLAGEATVIVVDPVMADNGKLYPAFSGEFPAGMRKLCSKADIIVPNMTEASLLLGEPYKEGPYTERYIDGVVKRLMGIGPQRIVLTGVYFDDELLGVAYRDGRRAQTRYMMSPKIPGNYHGTGDVFASALTAGAVKGLSLEASVRAAVDLTIGSIDITHNAGTDVRYGVNFEACLPDFIRDIFIQ
jgi:pyridoxine kinase